VCYTLGQFIVAEDSKSVNFIGIVLKFAYRLRRHWWLGWSLSRWWGLLFVITGVAALIKWWPSPWPAAVVAAIYLGYVAGLTWASRQGFVRFEPDSALPSSWQEVQDVPPLRKGEMAPVRASGWCSVEGQEQYFVDLDADFETVGTREHIVLARVHPSRFLLFGRWPSFERGWWYIFFQPTMIRGMTFGRLHFGPHPQLALRVTYAPNEKTRQTVYLASGDISVLRRIWGDILLDAPADLAAGGLPVQPQRSDGQS
jgi:hypothetical protein